MAQGYGSYNQFGQYGQIPGQAQNRFPSFRQGQDGSQGGQYPQGTFRAPNLGGTSSTPAPSTSTPAPAGTNTSDLSTAPPTGEANPSTAASTTTSTPAPAPAAAGAAGQQAPADTTPVPSQYPSGTFQGMTPMYGGGLGSNSTGPVNMALGQLGAPGAWDGGYNAFMPPPPQQQQSTAPASSAGTAPTAAPTPAAPVSTPQPAAPAVASATSPAVGTVDWMNSLTPAQQAAYVTGGAQQLANYRSNLNFTGAPMSDAWIAQQMGGNAGPGPSAETAAYEANQQAFTAHNQGYADSGYLGNQAQVMSQELNHAQSAGIPLGVLGSSFYQGGANYGGQQDAGNSMSGANGATDWTDPSVSSYGVDQAGIQNALRQQMLSQAFAQQGLSYPAGTFK